MLRLNKIYYGDCVELMKKIDDKSIDLIIADPPYGIDYLSNHYKYGNPHKKIINDKNLFTSIDELWRLLKNTGAMYIFYSHKKPLIDNRIKNIIIWVKNNWSAGNLFGDYGNQYECIAFMPQKNFKLKNERCSNVWNCRRVKPELHPTQKPVNLIKKIIRSATIENDIVLDPFIGSGTTAVACKLLDRNFIGIEINPDYVDIANKRLANTYYQQELIK